jgi:hypothetical protein
MSSCEDNAEMNELEESEWDSDESGLICGRIFFLNIAKIFEMHAKNDITTIAKKSQRKSTSRP